MNIKRILASLLAVTVVGANMPDVSVDFPKISLTANAADKESPLEYETLENGKIEILDSEETGLYLEYWTLKDGTIEILHCECGENVTKVEIPAEIDGKKVTSIGISAFKKSCEGVMSITIPDSVTSIGSAAFCDCSSLIEITIPDSVTSFGTAVFYSTPWFENKQKENPLVIVNGILIDGTTCSGDVIIPDNVKRIGNFAFRYCSGLTSITIPDSVTSIGVGAFDGTPWLENKQKENPLVITSNILIDGTTCSGDVVIPDNVTFIADCAFSSCSDLTSITIPDSVTSIGDGAFDGCSSLTEIIIPDSVTSIGEDAFYCCSDLTSITILNHDCEIYDSDRTISNGYYSGVDGWDFNYFNGTICGYENSTAQAYAEKYKRKFESLSDAPATKVIAGDANCDGKVSIADATAILQHLGNQDKYGLSAEGLKNADVDGNDGVSTNDALVIQKVDAKILTVEQLPLKK